MRTRAAIVLAVTLFAAAPPLPITGQQSAAPARATAEQVARLIADLDSSRFVLRERATRELLALKAQAVGPLRKALGQGGSVEFVRRASAILDSLAVYLPGGEAVNGLKLRLTADRDTVRMGETVKLTTALCNMTDKPLNVYIGYTYCGTYLECGSALHRAAPAVKGKELGEVAPQCKVGFCGTGAGPMYVTVPPKGLVTFQTPVTAVEMNGKDAYALGKRRFFVLESAGGIDAVRMVLTATPADNVLRGSKGVAVRPADEHAPSWTGAVRSNDVQIKVAR
jgi:hypothetical protein